MRFLRPELIRQIVSLSWPVLIAQLAYMAVAAADTILTGHYSTRDLAAVAIGNSVYVTVAVSLSNILQALSPTVAHLHGARQDDEIARTVQQGVWLAMLLGAAGAALLRHPATLIAWSSPEPEVERIAAEYLRTAALGFPAQMLFRTFYAFTAGLGRPRPVMAITVAGAVLDVPLAYGLIYGRLGWPPLGAVGCAAAAAIVAWLVFAAGLVLLLSDRRYRRYALFVGWERPNRRRLGELLRLGLPIGLSTLVEVSAFTLIALFIAPLGAVALAGHRIVANVFTLCYMLPLALGNGVAVLIAQAAGAREWSRARALAGHGMLLAAALASILAIGIWLGAGAIIGVYTGDAAVRAMALGLMIYGAVGHLFDATQTLASFALRGYKVTLGPMLLHVAAFWGVGLAGGWWLAFAPAFRMGVAGFWLASVASLLTAAALVGGLLWLASRRAP